MRGKLPESPETLRLRRITPACAGKTSRRRKASRESQDHPRVCGENLSVSRYCRPSSGSPPRVRGKRPASHARTTRRRITPACAGKTSLDTVQRVVREDHPRVCGENGAQSIGSAMQRGSPPRVRGKLSESAPPRRLSRITPACAGKTGFLVVAAHGSKDHPRVCGENLRGRGTPLQAVGSPPRVRGKPY